MAFVLLADKNRARSARSLTGALCGRRIWRSIGQMSFSNRGSRRILRPVLMGLIAIMIYGTGLIAPLTPSEGGPSLSTILIFVGIPLILIVGGTLITRSLFLKGILIIEALLIIAFTINLLIFQKII